MIKFTVKILGTNVKIQVTLCGQSLYAYGKIRQPAMLARCFMFKPFMSLHVNMQDTETSEIRILIYIHTIQYTPTTPKLSLHHDYCVYFTVYTIHSAHNDMQSSSNIRAATHPKNLSNTTPSFCTGPSCSSLTFAAGSLASATQDTKTGPQLKCKFQNE